MTEPGWRWYDGELLFRDTVRRRLLISFADMDRSRPCYVPDTIEFKLSEPDKWPGPRGAYGPGRFLLRESYRRVTAVEEQEALVLKRILAAEKREAARKLRPKVCAGKAKQPEPKRLYPDPKQPLGLFDDLPKATKH